MSTVPPELARAAPPLVLALDVGTSSVRCLAFDGAGRQVPGAVADSAIQVHYTPDGGAELDADAVLHQAVQCLAAVSGTLADAGHTVAGVGVCTFWHAFLAVDAAGAALSPIYLWNDTRSGAAAGALRRELDQGAIHRRTGCVLHTSYLPARLKWLAEARPEQFRQAARFVSFGEYLEQHLLGVARCGTSMASGTGLYNQQQHAWDAALLDALGLDEARLSPLEPEHAPAQGLQPAYAAELPHLRETPFFPALGDGACSNFGSGAVQPGVAALMVGTSGAMRLMFHEEAPPPPEGLWRYLLDRRRILIGGAISNGGSLFAWLTRTLQLPDEDELERQLAAAEPGAHGLTVLPFLAGERNPDFPLEATGVFAGLRAATTPFDLFHAGLESVAYRLAAIADRLQQANPELHRYLASGGLLQSPAWVRMMADVLGLPVSHSMVQEASARGAALMALEALGQPVDPAAEAVAPTVVEPDPARHARYAEARQQHEALYARFIRSGLT